LEDTLFAGAVIDRIGEQFTIHCDSSRMAVDMYRQQKGNLVEFAPQLTHYHRLVNRFGLIKDIEFCLTVDAASVLAVYRDGRLVAE
jgi:2-phosphosulfolactate phosphatase